MGSGSGYLIQGERTKDGGEWLYKDGSKVNSYYTQWSSQSNPTSNNNKKEYIVLLSHSNYTWSNMVGRDMVSGYICQA